jgi:outer membrane immunogenic protein
MRHFPIAAIAAAYAITFTTQFASAADLPVKATPAPAAAPYNWTGFYVGVNGGYGWKDPTVIFTPNDPLSFGLTCGGNFGATCVPPASLGISGLLGGVQAGYNWQINQNWVLGVEADFDWSNIKGTGNANVPLTAGLGTLNFLASETIKWFGTVRGRVGFLPTNNLLVYATGGFAFGRVTENAALDYAQAGFTGFGFALACNTAGGAGAASCLAGNSSRTATGYTVGAGAEYLLWRNLSLKAEYLYVNLGHGDAFIVTQAPTAFGTPASFTATYSTVAFNLVRAGLNWKF